MRGNATHAVAHHDGHRTVSMLPNTPGGQLPRGMRNLPYDDRLQPLPLGDDHIHCAAPRYTLRLH